MARMTKERFDKATERDMRNFFATLSEKDQRRYAAIQARQLGFGGMEYIAEVLGCSRRTISRGWKTFPICPMIRPRAGFDGQALVESDVSTRLAGPSPAWKERIQSIIVPDMLLPKWNYMLVPQTRQ